MWHLRRRISPCWAFILSVRALYIASNAVTFSSSDAKTRFFSCWMPFNPFLHIGSSRSLVVFLPLLLHFSSNGNSSVRPRIADGQHEASHNQSDQRLRLWSVGYLWAAAGTADDDLSRACFPLIHASHAYLYGSVIESRYRIHDDTKM